VGRFSALAPLTWWEKVIQTSDGKAKATKVSFEHFSTARHLQLGLLRFEKSAV